VTIADRYARLAFAAACRSHEADVIKFWYDTMMDHEADMAHPHCLLEGIDEPRAWFADPDHQRDDAGDA
jgi:hypothetical protein